MGLANLTLAVLNAEGKYVPTEVTIAIDSSNVKTLTPMADDDEMTVVETMDGNRYTVAHPQSTVETKLNLTPPASSGKKSTKKAKPKAKKASKASGSKSPAQKAKKATKSRPKSRRR